MFQRLVIYLKATLITIQRNWKIDDEPFLYLVANNPPSHIKQLVSQRIILFFLINLKKTLKK